MLPCPQSLTPGLRLAIVPLVVSFLWSGSLHSAEIILSEDFAAETGQWQVIRRGAVAGSEERAEIADAAAAGKVVKALHVEGTAKEAAVGVAVPLQKEIVLQPGQFLRATFQVAFNRVSGHSGTGGNALFAGFVRFYGGRPQDQDDDGFFFSLRSQAKPAQFRDVDAPLSFLSSGERKEPENRPVDFSTGEWLEVTFTIKAEADRYVISTRVNGEEFVNDFSTDRANRTMTFGSFVIAQGGGETAPADFLVRQLRVESGTE